MTLSEYLSALEALDRAATEGPWEWGNTTLPKKDGKPHARTVMQSSPPKYEQVFEVEGLFGFHRADFTFIAASRSALPLLCKIVRAQEALIAARAKIRLYATNTEKEDGVSEALWSRVIDEAGKAESTFSTLLAELKI